MTAASRGVEHAGHLGAAEAERVAEHEHGPLPGREVLQRGDECQSHRLSHFVARVRPRCRVHELFEQHVRVRLEPDRLAQASRLGRFDHGWNLPRAATPAAQDVQAPVCRDPVEPGANRCSPFELLESAPGGKQGLLHTVFGVLDRADDPVAVELQLAPEGVGELAERIRIPGPSARERYVLHGHLPAYVLFVRIPLMTPAGPERNRSGPRFVCLPECPTSSS